MNQMDCARAYKIIGGQAFTVPFNNMIRALQMHSWLNTPDQEERLAAALWVRKNAKAYRAYMQAQLDARSRGRA
jgi:hypothetical protein